MAIGNDDPAQDREAGKRSRSRARTLVSGLVAAAILAPVVWLTLLATTGEGELAEKPVIAMLQGLAMDDSANGRAGPILHRGPGHSVALGVPGRGRPADDQGSGPASTRMWVILNDHSGSRTIRQSNRYAGYDLGCVYVDGLRARVADVDDYAIAYLRTICRRR